MGWVMVRTARSPIFSQAHDFSCFIAGPTGEVVSQADGIPIHTGSGGFGVRAILRDFGDELADGDVYLLNDPWGSGWQSSAGLGDRTSHIRRWPDGRLDL